MSTITHLLHPRWSIPCVLALGLMGCQTEPYGDPGAPELARFASCDELRTYSADMMLETLVQSRYGSRGMWLDDTAESANDGAGGDAPTDFTTTNVQEGGVDEIDLVKTDGKFVYVAQDRALHIVKSWPIEDAAKVSTLELDGWVRGMFLRGDKVVVFSQAEADSGMEGYVSRATVIDVSDRAEPVVERQIDIEGWLSDGRMIDDDVYFVANHYLQLPQELWDVINERTDLPEVDWELEGDAFDKHLDKLREDLRDELRADVQRVARKMDLTDFLPTWRDEQGGDVHVGPIYDCRDVYRPNGVGQHGAMSIVNLDLGTGELNASGLLSDGWQLYASKDNLYVAQSSRWWWWGGGGDQETHIHQFHLDPDDQPKYVASGEVQGWIYDQFGFSEHEGVLRVATTDNDWWGGTDELEGGNNIFVMENTGGELKVIGDVTGIAPGERIFAVRYLGTTAYMVTFRQTDPLWAIDLTKPRNPRVVGELEMPGYSAYLHPMGDDHLLAVGMDGTEDGQLTGLAINVFDVSDIAEPKLAHQFTLEGSEWSGSEALWDHHAFTYHRGVLSIPFYEYHANDNDWRWFSGVLSVDASADGITEIGRVDHRPLVDDSECLWSRYYEHGEEVCDDWGWYAQVRRTVYIEDNLFSVSNYGIRVTDLNDPSVEHARVLFYPR